MSPLACVVPSLVAIPVDGAIAVTCRTPTITRRLLPDPFADAKWVSPAHFAKDNKASTLRRKFVLWPCFQTGCSDNFLNLFRDQCHCDIGTMLGRKRRRHLGTKGRNCATAHCNVGAVFLRVWLISSGHCKGNRYRPLSAERTADRKVAAAIRSALLRSRHAASRCVTRGAMIPATTILPTTVAAGCTTTSPRQKVT